MNTPPVHLQPLLAGLRAALDALYGERLDRLVLYGAQARGDTHAESDLDVLDGPVQPGREIRRVRRVRTKLGLKHERALPPACFGIRVSGSVLSVGAKRAARGSIAVNAS
jgi:predicted nucleotidyltransferase